MKSTLQFLYTMSFQNDQCFNFFLPPATGVQGDDFD